RAAVQSADRVVLPADAEAAAAAPRVSAPDSAGEVMSRSSAHSPLSANYLRFDDLRLHCAHPHWHLDSNVNVFFNPSLSEHAAEQFRTLRSRLYQFRGGQQLRTLLVTSAVPGEGKTFVTGNL